MDKRLFESNIPVDIGRFWVYILSMRNMRTFIIWICAALTALALLPMGGCARHKHIVVESGRVEDYYCSFYDDETVEITAYVGAASELKLPNKIGDYTVVGFGMKAFDGCAELERVYIPPTVKSLPSKLFNGCPKLEAFYFSGSVETIGKNVVFECPSFTQVLFGGTRRQWDAIDVGSVPWTDNYELLNAELLCDYVLDLD